MAAGVIAAAWGWQREPPSISLTTNSHEDGWHCTPQLISIYKGNKERRGGIEKERNKITKGKKECLLTINKSRRGGEGSEGKMVES